MKRTRRNLVVSVNPLTAAEKKKVMTHLTHGLKPLREDEVSKVEMNEEFGLAGKMMLALLYQWLSNENRKAMNRLLQFYHPLDKAMLIYALLLYLMTGKLLKMNNIVAQRHYKQMVEYVDDDMVTMPSHKHLMRLYIKYGLFEPIE